MSAPPTASPASSRRKRRMATAMITAGATLATTALALLPAGVANASSHREAPLISTMPLVDNTDTYSFVSPDKPDTVTFVANWFPFEEPNGGPNFYQWATNAHYNINIDSDGDGKADTTYRWDFTTNDLRDNKTFLYDNGPVTSLTDENLLFRQYYTLTEIKNGKSTVLIKSAQVAPSDTGPASVPDYSVLRKQATIALPGGGQTYVGQADDPFFLDLRVFDLLYGGNLSEVGADTLAGYNVNTIALQVPKGDVALKGDAKANPVIGVWATTDEKTLTLNPTGGGATPTGDFVQVSRLGNPLVNELVVPAGLKDAFNAISPDVDHTIPAVVARVTDPELARLIQAIYGIPAPKTPRNDLVEIFLTGIAKNAPTLDGSKAPIQADLNSQVLNAGVDPTKFVPAEEERLNLAVPVTKSPNRLGVLGGDLQGFPNGRRLTDDVVDIEIQAVEGAVANGLPVKIVPALAAGDKVDANDKPFGATFPYVALPHNTDVNAPGNTQAAAAVPGKKGAVAPGSTPGSGPTLPAASLITGIAAVILLGAGGLVIARRREETAPSTV